MSLETTSDLALVKLCIKAGLFTVEEYLDERKCAFEVITEVRRIRMSSYTDDFQAESAKVSRGRRDLLHAYLTDDDDGKVSSPPIEPRKCPHVPTYDALVKDRTLPVGEIAPTSKLSLEGRSVTEGKTCPHVWHSGSLVLPACPECGEQETLTDDERKLAGSRPPTKNKATIRLQHTRFPDKDIRIEPCGDRWRLFLGDIIVCDLRADTAVVAKEIAGELLSEISFEGTEMILPQKIGVSHPSGSLKVPLQ